MTWLWGLLAAALAVGALLVFLWWTGKRRDLVRRPEEKTVGYGLKRALLIYQPSNRGRNHAIAWELARRLARGGYTVTVNHPSPVLTYDPMDYDYLIFGGNAYLGELGRPLKDYLARLSFQGRQVLLFVVGDMERAPELADLRLRVPAGNQVRSIKVRPDEGAKLCQFALG